MILLKNLYIRNFLSFREQEYAFNQGITTCIIGVNETETGQKSNGSGKSALQSAVEFAITGNVSRKVNKNKLIYWGCDEAFIRLILFDNIKHEEIIIERTIPSKGSEILEIRTILKNGKAQKEEFPSVRTGNDWIENRVGISRKDISNYFIVNEINYVSFFNSPDSAKKELISRFSNADIIDSVFKIVIQKEEQKDGERSNKRDELSRLESKLETLKEQLEKELSYDFEAEKQTKINSIQNLVDKYTEDAFKHETAIKETKKEVGNILTLIPNVKHDIEKLQKELKDFLLDIDFDSNIKEKKNELNKIQERLSKSNEVEKEIKLDKSSIFGKSVDMQTIIDGGVTCPNCKHEFNPGITSITVEQARKDLIYYRSELKEIEKEIENLDKLKIKYSDNKDNVLKEIRQIESKRDEALSEKSKISIEIKKAENKIKSYQEDLDFKQKTIDRLKGEIKRISEAKQKYFLEISEIKESTKDKTRENELNKNILDVENLIFEKQKEIQETDKELIEIKRWNTSFKLFKSNLANKKLRVIQDMINKYLLEMNCDYQLKLEGFKQLASGETSEKITPYIFKNGSLCDYGEFSKGERARIDFATLTTLQTLVNETSPKGGLDILFCDEVMEGLDTLGLNSILNSFQKIGKTSFITTHTLQDHIYDNILMIKKVGGISKIVENV